MEPYNWVSTGSIRKFHRAVDELKKAGKEVTEEAVKELYVKWGGLVLEKDAAAAEESDTDAEAPAHSRKARRMM